MKRRMLSHQHLFSTNTVLMVLAIGYFLLQIAATIIGSRNGGYGYFIDEFYYITCAKRLAFGYVDHPPLAPFILRLVLETLGDSLLAIRLLPALAEAMTLFFTGLIARELGAGKWGQFTAALAMAVAPVFLVMSGFFSMNPFETLLWTTYCYILIRLIQTDNPKLWLVLGALLGLGLLNKHTLLTYVGSLFIGILFTPARKYLLNKWLWAGMLIAGMLILPNLIWQFQNGFPSLEFYRNATFFKNIDTLPVDIVGMQLFSMNPFTTPIWLIGVGWLLVAQRARQYRMFGISYIILLGLLIVARSSRPDRILASYPILFAAGTVAIQQGIRQYPILRLSKVAIVTLLAISGLILMPFAIPIMPPEHLARIGSPVDIEKGVNANLPQWLADRFGWEELVSAVAEAYQTLSPEEQGKVLIFAENYGSAGAIDLFGEQYQLPNALSGHNTYWLWGTGNYRGEVAIVIGGDLDELRHIFTEVQPAGVAQCTYCRPSDQHRVIYICKGLTIPLEQLWIQLKYYG